MVTGWLFTPPTDDPDKSSRPAPRGEGRSVVECSTFTPRGGPAPASGGSTADGMNSQDRAVQQPLGHIQATRSGQAPVNQGHLRLEHRGGTPSTATHESSAHLPSWLSEEPSTRAISAQLDAINHGHSRHPTGHPSRGREVDPTPSGDFPSWCFAAIRPVERRPVGACTVTCGRTGLACYAVVTRSRRGGEETNLA